MADNFRFDYLEPAKVTESQISDINKLLKQLTDKPDEVNESLLRDILNQSGVSIFVIKNLDGRIIAMATLAVRRLLLNKTAIIGDVVVDEHYRGLKLGKKLMEYSIKSAKLERVSFISLTSHPRRKEANSLYQSLGFKLIGTVGESNYYRLAL